MLKKLGTLFLSLLFFSGISVYAQTGNPGTGIAAPTIQVQAFNNLRARHCDQGVDSDSLTIQESLALKDSETKTLCNAFINQGDFPIEVQYAYVDAKIGDSGTPNCDINSGTFGNMVSTSEPTTFTIPAHGNVVRYDKLFLPPGMKTQSGGIIRGCLGYGVVSAEAKPGEKVSMFKILTRKVILYTVFVGNAADINASVSLESPQSDIFTTNKKIKASLDKDGGLVISATIKNNGNIDQIVSLSGKIYNFLGFEKDFSLGERKISPYQTVELSNTIGVIPVYKGLFDVQVEITHKPSLDYDIPDLSGDIMNGGAFYEQGKIFIFSRYIIGIIAFIILFLWLLFRRRRKA